ncbi:MAG: molybdopterin oxidoreductase [Phycisphaerae bacterium]|nr:molybdopterin oxidoreductase [Phycisphaerae bacterium]
MSSLNEPNKNGKTWWRSLDEVVATEDFQTQLKDEFPEGAGNLLATGDDRRHFLKIMGASMALAGLGVAGCRRWPKENIVPYANRPENTMPGIPEQYASCFDFGGISQGVLVTSNDGRPTKIEGNPEHPDSQGKTDAFTQAAILDLYDPDRSRKVTFEGADSSLAAFKEWVASYLPNNGEGIAVLSEPSSSPTFARMRKAFMKKNPQAMWVEYTPLANINQQSGLNSAFDGNWIPVHDIAKATTIVSLDADFLGAGPLQVPNTRGWANGRKVSHGKMSRVWIAEPGLSVTGANADERSPMNPAAVATVATYIAKQIAHTDMAIDGTVALTAEQQTWADTLVADLQHAGKHGLVMAGASQPASVHYLVAQINEALGSVGTTVSYRSAGSKENATIQSLSTAMENSSVQGVIILGGNPAYDAPAELNIASAIEALPFSIHLANNEDETSNVCKWHVNAAHWLESWGDGLAADGTICVGQPLIQPLFNGVTPTELLAILAGEEVTDGQTLVRATLFGASADNRNVKWRNAVHDGVVANSAMLEKPPVARKAPKGGTVVGGVGYTACFVPSGAVWDGTHANNGWLQELPDSITKLTWDNAALISPKTAEALSVKQGDMLKVSVGSKNILIAALPVPGTADDVVMLPLGYGRTFEGRICSGAGTDVYPLRSTKNSWSAPAKISATGDTYPLATTQMHFGVDTTPGHGAQERLPLLFREGTLDQYNADPAFASHVGHVTHSLSIFEEQQFVGAQYKWGMTIDLSTCTGCNACVAACHAENNIPIVGKDQVLMGREMHWIRIDRYFAFGTNGHGGYDGNDLKAVAIQPMTCSHCENAPCEEVCPVAATVHDTDGLNVMVYNRCVGTRYCSNNCPFKVRRFNYFDYFRRDPLRSTGLLQVQPDYYVKAQSGGKTLRAMQFNPEVTVRMRGVMEKCTYCTQRIQRVKIATKNAWVKKTDAQKQSDQRVAILDGSIVTACEQACPAGAIVFGDLLDNESRVSKNHNEKRSYEMLEELNLKSRTKYLARLTNPVDGAVKAQGGHH